jgi:membrane protease subunit (stomatin/prohibitin family)
VGSAALPTTTGISAAAPAGTSSWWKNLLGIGSKADAIRTGANLAGNYLQSRQVDKAVQAQVDAANKALDLQSNIYQQQRSDLAPYRNVGSASIGELSRLMGLPAGSDTTTPYFQQQAQGQQQAAQQQQQTDNRQPPATPTQAAPRGTVASLGDGFVNMVSPDGRPARVPQAQVQSALAAGGRMA